MKIISRYLAITVMETTLMVLIMLLGLAIFIAFVKEIGDVGTGEYGLFSALTYILLDMPQQLYSFFPMASLLGVMLGLSLLANHSELVVLRVSGVSLGKITWLVMKAAIIMLVIATLIGEGVAPAAHRFAENRKALLTSGGQALTTAQGTWVRDGGNFLYIRTVINGDLLQGVNRYQFNNQQALVNSSYAPTVVYRHGQWIAQHVVGTQITDRQVKTNYAKEAVWNLNINPRLLKISEVDPNDMSLKQLYYYIHYLEENGLNTSSYTLALWQRILQPLATLVMIWLAIPFVFGPLRSKTIGLRLVIGIIAGFSFYILNQFFGPLSIVYQLPPLLAAAVPLLLFAAIAYGLQRRIT